MKPKEKLNAIKEEAESLNKKFAELTDDDLMQVSGGVMLQYSDNVNDSTAFRPLKQRTGEPLDIVE